MADTLELEKRVQELEIKYTEQQHILNELSEAVFGQHRMLDNLAHGLTLLKQRLESGGGSIDRAADDTPPHY